MNKQSKLQNPKPKILVVGAGPAGVSLAIRLAKKGFEVCLIERDKFPRHKLCGEFVSPECLEHFKELNVFDEMISIGGDRITETVFYAPNGKFISIPSEWFNADQQSALSISRAEMDFHLLEKAKKIGVKVLEETQVIGLLFESQRVCGVKARVKTTETIEILADLTIDATGRANILGKLAAKIKSAEEDKKLKGEKNKNRLVGFKTHLKNVNLEKGRCEIYFFRGGYGGLSFVENNLANHCFLIKADVVKEFNGQTNKLLENVIFQNKRAFETMKDSEPVFDWLAVSVESFGRKNLSSAPNLLSIGDAAAFIDPFTGSGMLMALESGRILAEIITNNVFVFNNILEQYKLAHQSKFQNRLRLCSMIRRAAFMPNLTKMLVSVLSLSKFPRKVLAQATRQTLQINKNK